MKNLYTRPDFDGVKLVLWQETQEFNETKVKTELMKNWENIGEARANHEVEEFKQIILNKDLNPNEQKKIYDTLLASIDKGVLTGMKIDDYQEILRMEVDSILKENNTRTKTATDRLPVSELTPKEKLDKTQKNLDTYEKTAKAKIKEAEVNMMNMSKKINTSFPKLASKTGQEYENMANEEEALIKIYKDAKAQLDKTNPTLVNLTNALNKAQQEVNDSAAVTPVVEESTRDLKPYEVARQKAKDLADSSSGK